MANRDRGELRLVSGGVAYTLRLTTNAAAELEDQSGQTFQRHIEAWTLRGSLIALRWILWAALQDQHADQIRSVRDVGPLIDQAENLPALIVAFAALNLEPIQELLQLGVLKLSSGDGSARPRIAQDGPHGTRTIAPFARSA